MGLIDFFFRNKRKAIIDAGLRDITNFVKILSEMDDDEVGLAVTIATYTKFGMTEMVPPHLFEIEADDPSQNLFFHQEFMTQVILEKQRIGELEAAAGIMVWCFSLRAICYPELAPMTFEMWKHLERGFGHFHPDRIHGALVEEIKERSTYIPALFRKMKQSCG